MKFRLEKLLKAIKEETGVEAKISQKEMAFFEGIISKNGKTYFSVKYELENLVLYISGETDFHKQTALLLKKHIVAELQLDKEQTIAEKIKSLSTGSIEGENAIKVLKELKLENYKNCVIFFTLKDGDLDYLKTILEKYKKNQCDCYFNYETALVFVKFFDIEEDETAFSISQKIMAEKHLENQHLIAYISGVNEGKNLRNSFNQAKLCFDYRDKTRFKEKIYSFTDFALLKVLEEVPKVKLKEVYDLLANKGLTAIFNDEDLMQTCEAFFKNDLNVSLSARALYMHRNTLMYRIDKIEKETGLDIKKFSDAETFKMLSIIYKLVK